MNVKKAVSGGGPTPATQERERRELRQESRSKQRPGAGRRKIRRAHHHQVCWAFWHLTLFTRQCVHFICLTLSTLFTRQRLRIYVIHQATPHCIMPCPDNALLIQATRFVIQAWHSTRTRFLGYKHRGMRRRHAISSVFSGHYQDLELSI